MKSSGIKLFILSLVVVFLGDAVNCDILVSEAINAVFHTQLNSISREVIAGKGTSNTQTTSRSIAGSINMAQDEDSPTVLDTAFPVLHNAIPIPDLKPGATSPGTVQYTYLSLCTLLL